MVTTGVLMMDRPSRPSDKFQLRAVGEVCAPPRNSQNFNLLMSFQDEVCESCTPEVVSSTDKAIWRRHFDYSILISERMYFVFLLIPKTMIEWIWVAIREEAMTKLNNLRL